MVRFIFNFLPNDGMATGGVGNVLSGILGGLLAQDLELKKQKESLMARYEYCNKSICMAVYLHSLAGQYAALDFGERAMTATTVIDSFSKAFKEIKSKMKKFSSEDSPCSS